ncbi:YidH family protein [Rhodococcus sp. NPDC003322]
MSLADAVPAGVDTRGDGPVAPHRWRPQALRDGVDPDPRFTLANERTFLAWMRTAMGLIAGAVGFEAFGPETVSSTVHLALVLGMLAGAATLSVFAFARWLGVENALRHGRGLPVPALGALLVVLVGGIALVLLVALAVR